MNLIMIISSQSLAQSSFISFLCGVKKERDGLCHQRKENSDWASNPARVCQESNAQACPPAVLGWSAAIKADTVQLTIAINPMQKYTNSPKQQRKSIFYANFWKSQPFHPARKKNVADGVGYTFERNIIIKQSFFTERISETT